MFLPKKAGILTITLLMLAVGGCSTPAPSTLTEVITRTDTATATLTQTNTATMTRTSTVTATTTTIQTTVETVVLVTINISAASSLTAALNEANKVYATLKPWVTLATNYGGSGTLQTQIEQGAPCDVFISAAAAQMDNLQNENLLLPGSRINLLTNKIALIVPKGNPLGLTSFNDLTLSKVKLIAVGDPKSVPAGAYASTAFIQLGILTAIQSKFILGANVTQMLQYVDSGNVDAGIVYSTDALSDNNVVVVATGPSDVNATIVYPGAIIKDTKVPASSQDYLNFLGSPQAKAIFTKYGFANIG